MALWEGTALAMTDRTHKHWRFYTKGYLKQDGLEVARPGSGRYLPGSRLAFQSLPSSPKPHRL
jgi:hypothetical protein